MDYELIKQLKGYVLAEINDVNVKVETHDIKDIRKAKDIKVIASTEVVEGTDYAKLRIEDCNELFGIKETRQPKVSENYADAKYGTLEELKGIQEIVRLQMYNYLTGRMTHKAFIQFYHEYETMLHEHGIIKVNEWNLDEHLDDEYFNDNLDAPELQRELGKPKVKIMVTVSTLKDEDGYVAMFKK
jgi:hypothetical protein